MTEENKEFLSKEDVYALELAKANKLNAALAAEKAELQSNFVDLQYKNLILQIYLKYGLSESDSINASGEIQRGGAVQGSKV